MITWHQDLLLPPFNQTWPLCNSNQTRESATLRVWSKNGFTTAEGVPSSNAYLIFVENEAEAQTASLEKNFLKVGF